MLNLVATKSKRSVHIHKRYFFPEFHSPKLEVHIIHEYYTQITVFHYILISKIPLFYICLFEAGYLYITKILIVLLYVTIIQ